MRGDPIQMLRYEASRRPEIAALVARGGLLSDREIDEAVVPLPWYRHALRALRDQERAAAAAAIFDESIRNQGLSEEPIRKEISGTIYEWTCDVTVKIDRNNGLEQKAGKLFFMPFSGGVWYETVFTENIDPQIATHSVSIGDGTRNLYIETYKAKQMRYCTTSTQIIDLTGNQGGAGGFARPNPLAHLGVTFR